MQKCYIVLELKEIYVSLNLVFSVIFTWLKFTLKPPNTIMHENLLLVIWGTSHWNFFVKF